MLSPANKPLLFSPYTIASTENSFEARPNTKGENRAVFTEDEESLEGDDE